jgi:small subunit ribosomal protein S8|nr:ribosomal protein S8 [Actinophrys sol]
MREISNALITIRNSLIARRPDCHIKSRSPILVFKILRVLYEEGFILNYIFNTEKNTIHVIHNYYKSVPTLSILKIFNKASFPLYLKYTDLCAIHKFGIDLIILSTTKGIMPHYKALKLHLGGKAICYVR